MVETLKELNEQAIKDRLLLPDGGSYRKNFSHKLGQELTSTEDRGYRIIHELTKKGVAGIVPAGVDEIFKNTYMVGESYQVTERDANTVEVLVNRIREKLGKTAIECAWGNNGYRSRRKVIKLAGVNSWLNHDEQETVKR